MRSRRRFVCCLSALPFATAWALDAPSGPIVLTVSGRLRLPNVGARAHFDMDMLERLPQHSFVTRTPWYTMPRKFTGPLLRDVLAACGAAADAHKGEPEAPCFRGPRPGCWPCTLTGCRAAILSIGWWSGAVGVDPDS